MKLWMNVAAAVLLVVGLIWTLQGANVIGGSFMTGQSRWLYIGLVVAACGIAALLWLNLRGGAPGR